MRFATLLATLAAAALASAQNQTVTVNVGGNGSTPFQFSPSTITASNGSVVTFQFTGIPGNHSVTQSTFANPCQPAPGGFDSGWILIGAPTTPPPQWDLTITNDKEAIWFYCKQLLPSPHCTAGMVGAINVQPGANNFGAFQSAAVKATGLPGQEQNGLVGIGASASAEPVVPSGATHFLGVSATSTAPAGGASGGASGSGGAPGSSGSPTNAPSGAVPAISFNFNLVAAFAGVFAGAVMVL